MYKFLAVLCALLQLLIMYFTYRVFKIIQCRNKSLLAMIIFMNATIFSKIILYSIQARISQKIVDDDNDISRHFFAQTMPVVFLEMTIVLNLNSWAFYYIKISEMKEQQTVEKISRKKCSEKVQSGAIQIVTIILAVLILILEFSSTFQTIHYQN